MAYKTVNGQLVKVTTYRDRRFNRELWAMIDEWKEEHRCSQRRARITK